jgi:hypothetical protein
VDDSIAVMLGEILATGDDQLLRAHLIAESRLPGPRMNLEAVASFARAVGEVVRGADPPVGRLEELLDGLAALSTDSAPADSPEVILPCAAVAAYGEVGALRPEWWGDEIAKIRRAAGDSRWRVREIVAQALQRLLDADWSRTMDALRQWIDGNDARELRAVAAAVAEPVLLGDPTRATLASELQCRVVERYRSFPSEQRRTESARALRQALGFRSASSSPRRATSRSSRRWRRQGTPICAGSPARTSASPGSNGGRTNSGASPRCSRERSGGSGNTTDHR